MSVFPHVNMDLKENILQVKAGLSILTSSKAEFKQRNIIMLNFLYIGRFNNDKFKYSLFGFINVCRNQVSILFHSSEDNVSFFLLLLKHFCC